LPLPPCKQLEAAALQEHAPVRALRLCPAASRSPAPPCVAGCSSAPAMHTHRLWQVWMSRRTYASMKGDVMPTSLRSGSTNCAWLRSFLMKEKM
jgi:hypothetical protein